MGRFSWAAGRGRPAVTVVVTVQISVATTEVVTMTSRVNHRGSSVRVAPADRPGVTVTFVATVTEEGGEPPLTPPHCYRYCHHCHQLESKSVTGGQLGT